MNARKSGDGSHKCKEEEVFGYLKKALEYLYNEEYIKCIEHTDKAIEIRGDKDSTAFYIKAKSLEVLGEYSDALESANKAIEIGGDFDADVYYVKAKSLQSLGEYDDALEAANKVIELGKTDPVDYNMRADIFLDLNRYESALKDLETVLKLDPKNNTAKERKKEIKLRRKGTSSNETTSVIDDLKNKINSTPLSSEAKEFAKAEISAIESFNDSDNECVDHIMNLKYLLKFPWGKYKPTKVDLISLEKNLNKDHYGLLKVKTKILESFVFSGKDQANQLPVLCLVGPAGVGKTSIAHSIAKSLDRKLINLPLGGLEDGRVLRGLMRFYRSSKPSKIISLISESGTLNPVMVLDEIDKLDNRNKSGIEGILLSLLDPQQNSRFMDDYFDITFDLSKMMFIATANSIEDISYPLRNRMEIIYIDGYTDNEKLQIAKKYLLPKIFNKINSSKEDFQISDSIIKELIQNYTRESGVRGLERKLKSLIEKYELDKMRGNKPVLSKSLLEQYFATSKREQKKPIISPAIGKVNGLAWTESGGNILPIEARIVPGSGKIETTGKLGEILKESIKAAYTCVVGDLEESNKKKLSNKDLKDNDSIRSIYKLQDEDLHIHFPEMATPKDGPSAGIALYTLIKSVLTGKKIRQDIAMTGELSLYGDILPIGGIKEKLSSAVRDNIKTVILPESNKSDLTEIPDEIKKSIKIEFVSDASSIASIALADTDEHYAFNRSIRQHGNIAKADKNNGKNSGNKME